MLFTTVIVLGASIALQSVYSQNRNELSKPPIFKKIEPYESRYSIYSSDSIEKGHEVWLDRPMNDLNGIQEKFDFVCEIRKFLAKNNDNNSDAYNTIIEECDIKDDETNYVDVVDNNIEKYRNNFLKIFDEITSN